MDEESLDEEILGERGQYVLREDSKEVLEFVQSVTFSLLERVVPYKRKSLTLKMAGECLGVLGKVWNLSEYPPTNYIGEMICSGNEERLMDREGYVDDYQYLHLEAVDMDLTEVSIIPMFFVWLLSVNLSGNLLTNEAACPVTRLPNIVALRLNRNKFKDPYMPAMKHLQYLGLNENRIKSLHRIYHPNLETLDLNYNRIQEIDPDDCWKLTKLKQLELRGNHLQTTSGLRYVTLVNLYLAENQITQIEDMELLVNLERLHLRENPLSDLSGFSATNSNLKYLNIRQCHVNEVEELKKLSVLAGLRELIIKGNNFNPEPEKTAKFFYDEEEGEEEEEEQETEAEAEDENEDEEEAEDEEENERIRIQILIYLPNLKRIDKKAVTKEELERAKEMIEEDDLI